MLACSSFFYGKDELQALRLNYNVLPDENRYFIKIKINVVFKHVVY